MSMTEKERKTEQFLCRRSTVDLGVIINRKFNGIPKSQASTPESDDPVFCISEMTPK